MRLDSIISRTKVEPRPYQRRIVSKAVEMFCGRWKNSRGHVELPARSVMIESPTGSGKTVMALLACKALQDEYPELVIGWVAMRRNLLAQASRENTEKGINVQNIHFVSMFDKSPEALVAAKAEWKRCCW